MPARMVRQIFKKRRFSASGRKGFTLVEVMVAVALLAFGIVSIYEALFVSLDTFSYYSNYLNVQIWADEKMWEMQDRVLRLDIPPEEELTGEFVANNNKFNWKLTVLPLIEERGIYELTLILSWKEGVRNITVSRQTYALAVFKPKLDVL